MGNLTSAGATTNITLDDLEPVYKQTVDGNQTSLVDDEMRHFPGNAEDSANLLDVQCWAQPQNQASHQCIPVCNLHCDLSLFTLCAKRSTLQAGSNFVQLQAAVTPVSTGLVKTQSQSQVLSIKSGRSHIAYALSSCPVTGCRILYSSTYAEQPYVGAVIC